MKKSLVVIITLVLLCISVTVTFGFSLQLLKPGLSGYGARADAMGGAFTAVADDGFTPYFNPAGITQLKAIAINGDISFLNMPESDAALISGFAGITTSSLAGNVYFDDRTTSDLQYFGTSYYVLSAATTLFGKSLSIGGNAKLVRDATESSNDSSTITVGTNFAYDLGGLFKASDYLSIGAVGRNLNDPTITMVNASGQPSGENTIPHRWYLAWLLNRRPLQLWLRIWR